MKSDNKETITFKSFLDILKLYKIRLFAKVMIVCAIIMIYSFIMPHTYESNTSIMPPKQSESGGLSGILQSMAGMVPSGISLGGLSSQSNVSLVFADIIRSRSTAEYIIDSLQLDKHKNFQKLSELELIEAVQKMINVTVLRNGLIIVSSKLKSGFFPGSEDKNNTAVLVSKVAVEAVNALDVIVRKRNTSSAKKSRIYVERELIDYREKLDSIDIVLENFQKTNRVLKIDDQTQALVKQAIEVGLQLAKAEMELNVAKSEYSHSHPYVVQLEQIVVQLRRQYDLVQSGGLTGTDGFSIPFDEIPNLARQYTNIYRDKKIYEQVILYLETQRHQEAIQESRDVPVVEPLDAAYIPEKQSAPSKRLMLLLSFVLSTLLFSGYHVSIHLYKNSRK